MKLILASQSPRRIELLKKLGFEFEVIPSTNPERTDKKLPGAQVRDLAFKKAFDIAQKNPDAIVIGADTLVYCKKEVIGKPKDKADALRILNKLNASWQAVYTGMCILCVNKRMLVRGVEKTRCKARRLPPEELQSLAGKHMDKAGAYAVQDKDDRFIERMVGSRTNVVGFPTELFLKMLKEFSVYD